MYKITLNWRYRDHEARQQRFWRISYGVVFYQLAKVILYLYYLHRIKVTFDLTAFGISDKFYQISKTLLLVPIIVFSVSNLILHILGNETEYFHLTVQFFAIEYIIGVALDIFWGTFLTILFLIRMKKIVKLNRKISNSNTSDNRIQKVGYKFRYLTSKLTILYIIVFITSIVAFVSTVIDIHLFSMILMDSFINTVCLILSFNFFDKSYKILCILCRKCYEPKV